jgi:hypothetical protein
LQTDLPDLVVEVHFSASGGWQNGRIIADCSVDDGFRPERAARGVHQLHLRLQTRIVEVDRGPGLADRVQQIRRTMAWIVLVEPLRSSP